MKRAVFSSFFAVFAFLPSAFAGLSDLDGMICRGLGPHEDVSFELSLGRAEGSHRMQLLPMDEQGVVTVESKHAGRGLLTVVEARDSQIQARLDFSGRVMDVACGRL